VKKTLIILALVSVVGLLAFAADVPAGEETIKLEAKMGAVTFQHKDHAARVEGDCKTCHHTLEADATPEACSACHDKKAVKDGAPKLRNALHKTCGDCHAEKEKAGEKHGPLTSPKAKQCKECHKKG